MELGYMDEDEPDSIFGTQTTAAVNHFKKQHGLAEDGIVDEATYDLLMSDAAQYYTISLGAKDTDTDTNVTQMQERLVELGYMEEATGYYGEITEAAVKKFQKMNHLTEDGSIGRETREKLYSDDVVANSFIYGEQSDQILAYQEKLKALGYLMTEPDGRFGRDTKEAVQRFQEANGLIADGYIGPATREALMSGNAQGSALSIGDQGAQVETVQKRLKQLRYFSGDITGYFGSATEAAVRKFQKRNNLTVDGRVGPQTLSVLMSNSARKAASTSSSSGSSSGSHSSSGSSSGSNGSGSPAVITGANIESFISVAESKLGCEYTRGAKGPNEFDCSGFVYWCLRQVGVNQGYMTSYAWRTTTRYTRIENMSDLQRGDIIVYKGHVAICAGGGYQIDASSSNDKVVRRSYSGSYWSRKFVCGYRIF
jgi:peptidoglycan hydrolase-like protein with peptidoglycan-binding domain